MKVRIGVFVLKIIALVTVISLLYPGILVLRTVLYNSAGSLLPGILSIFAGFMCAFVIYGTDGINIFKKMAYIALIAGLNVFVAISYGSGDSAVFDSVIAAAFFLLGFIKYNTEFSKIPDVVIKYIGLINITASFILMFTFDWLRHLALPLMALICALAISYLILKNQNSLIMILGENEGERFKVPGSIRIFNLAIVGMVLLSVIILVVILDFVFRIARAAGKVLAMLAGLLEKLSDRVSAWLASTGAGNEGTVVDPGIGRGIDSRIWDFLKRIIPRLSNKEIVFIKKVLLVLAMAVCLVLLYLLFIKIKKAVSGIFRRLGAFVSKILGKLMTILKARFLTLYGKNEYKGIYEDKVEFFNFKLFDKDEEKMPHRYGSTPRGPLIFMNPAERVRYIYAKVISLISKNVDIKKSDTTRQIYVKALKLDGIQGHMGSLTDIYEKVRYDDYMPEAEEAEKAAGDGKSIEEAISG